MKEFELLISDFFPSMLARFLKSLASMSPTKSSQKGEGIGCAEKESDGRRDELNFMPSLGVKKTHN
jgi:hypothetical protein